MYNAIDKMIAISLPYGMEWVIIALLALLIFGRRLPEVARNLGRSVSDFKKGLKDASETKDELHNQTKDVINDVKKEISQ